MKVRLKEICEGSCNKVNILDSPANPVYEGTPLEIIEAMMRNVLEIRKKNGSVRKYLKCLTSDMRELGLKVSFSGKTNAEMAESFLNSCRDAKLLTVIE